jgi:hypothetical protein
MNGCKFGKSAAFFLLALVMSLLLAGNAFAQTDSSSISGTITDPQGKVVAGATVILSNPEKHFSRTQTTNESGTFTFSSIPPDTYTLDVTITGFKKAVVNDIHALVANRPRPMCSFKSVISLNL